MNTEKKQKPWFLFKIQFLPKYKTLTGKLSKDNNYFCIIEPRTIRESNKFCHLNNTEKNMQLTLILCEESHNEKLQFQKKIQQHYLQGSYSLM